MAVSTPDEGALRARSELMSALDRSRQSELDELNRLHHGARHRSLLLAWAAAWLRRRQRAAMEPLPEVAPGEVGVTWIGHSSTVIRTSRLVIATDPNLAMRLGAARRAVEPGLAAAELQDVGLVLISNADPDHLHVPTLARLPRSATIAVPSRCAGLVSELGFARIVELAHEQTLHMRGVEIAALPARRSGPRGACAWMLRGDGPSLYFCGASGYGPHFAAAGASQRPDVAILPIGGYLPRALRADHMSPQDTLYAFDDLRARLLVPIRYGTFLLSYERLEDPMRWLAELVRERGLDENVAALPAGASRKFSGAVSVASAPPA